MKFQVLKYGLIILLLAAPQPAPAADLKETLFTEVYQSRDAAAAVDAKQLAPKTWARASNALETAEKDLAREANLLRIREKIESAKADYVAATAIASRAKSEFATLLKVRREAREVDGYLHAPDSWKRAEDRFYDALVKLEANDLEGANRRSDEAQEAYREAELAAIKAGYLLQSRNLLAQAEASKAGRYAPKTLESARRLLARADEELTQNRYDADLPRSLARDANYEARHALYLSEYIRQQRSEKAGWEDIILECEQSINGIAAAAELAVAFDKGIGPPATAIVEYVQKERADRRRLEREVEERNEQIYAMQEELTRLEEKLGGVSKERIALSRRLEAQEQVRQRFDRVEGMFEAGEGEVLRAGQNVILRLTGLQFDSGKSEVAPDHLELLAKVMSAISEFPGARIVIEGNTDSHGSDKLNDRLSTDRARAVRKYLLANMDLMPTRVDSTGYGESRPIASNDTREGRARNRRIDIVIQTQDGGG